MVQGCMYVGQNLDQDKYLFLSKKVKQGHGEVLISGVIARPENLIG